MRRAAVTAVALVTVVLSAADLGSGTSAAAGSRAASYGGSSVPVSSGSAAGARLLGAAAGDCTMHRYSKRVVRRVHRHGQLRTVRRTRHWWRCDPAPPQPAPAASAPSPDPAQAPGGTPAVPDPAPTPEPEPELEPGPTHLSVKADEYSYVLSRQTVEAGEVTIELDNRGQDAHNLNLRPIDGEEAALEIAETESLQRRTAHFTLQPGSYRLWCSLPTHDEEGMHATLAVEAP